MADESEKELIERAREILEQEEKKERTREKVPSLLLGAISVLTFVAIIGIIYSLIKIPEKQEKRDSADTKKGIRNNLAETDVDFNSKFLKVAKKADFIDSWSLNKEKNKLIIRVNRNWHKMNNPSKITALKILKKEFVKAYSESSLSKKPLKSPEINIINYNSEIIAVCDEKGVSLKKPED